jgi:two-component system response regulator (stage 0 sporulation protein F)
MINKKTILVVDDSQLICDLFRHILKNYTLFIAQSGKECLKILKKHRPDLILLDLQLPGIDGFETLKRIKECDSSIEVILITAFGIPEFGENAIRLGAKAFLEKPFDVNQLISLVQ